MTGLHLAQYRIDAELGRGGMGIVYRATPEFIVAALLLAMAPGVQSAGAQDVRLPRATPESVGMSSERLSAFDEIAAEQIEMGRYAGVVTMVLRRGKVVYESALGSLDLETQAPMRHDALFRIASQTKFIMSVATMILVEEGRITLREPVSRYLPWFEPSTVWRVSVDTLAKRPVTVRDLLTHTSGVAGPGDLPVQLAERFAVASLDDGLLNHLDESIGDLVRRLGTLPLVAQPGERFVYGFSTDVLGAVIEEASGLALDQFLRQRIFEPLGMHDTFFFVPRDKMNRFAANHVMVDGRLARSGDSAAGWNGQGNFVDGPRRLFSGAGGLVSTVEDYALLLQMVLDGGILNGSRILSPVSTAVMSRNHVGELYAKENGAYPGMGFGFNVEVKVDEAAGGWDVPSFASKGSFGWGGAAGTTFWVDPTRELIGLFMTQRRPPSSDDLHRRFAGIVYGALLDE